jgi:hypothetical protein
MKTPLVCCAATLVYGVLLGQFGQAVEQWLQGWKQLLVDFGVMTTFLVITFSV